HDDFWAARPSIFMMGLRSCLHGTMDETGALENSTQSLTGKEQRARFSGGQLCGLFGQEVSWSCLAAMGAHRGGKNFFCGVTVTRTEALVLEKRVVERGRVCRATISDCGSGGCNADFSRRVIWSFFAIGGVEHGACFVFAQHASSLRGRMVAEVEVATARLFCATAIFCTHLTAHLSFLEAVRRRTLASG
ncbi:hypothetical protein TcCL_NonESM02526, partial [Trypanosoma cruzi]